MNKQTIRLRQFPMWVMLTMLMQGLPMLNAIIQRGGRGGGLSRGCPVFRDSPLWEGSASVLFTWSVFFLKRALLVRVCMRRERGGALTRSSRVSQQPHLLLGVTHFPCSARFHFLRRALEGPRNKKGKEKKKSPPQNLWFAYT